MSLRLRMILATAAAVAVSVALVAAASYVLLGSELMSQVERSLQARAGSIVAMAANAPDPRRLPKFPPPPRPINQDLPTQILERDGSVLMAADLDEPLPISAGARRVAAGEQSSFEEDVEVGGASVRILTVSMPDGAVQIARSLEEVESVLARMRLILLGLIGLGVALGAVLGLLVARSTLAPVRRLSQASEHVATTLDLDERIEPSGGEELSRLAVNFNRMLSALGRSTKALQESATAQKQLVADASHELRTPLTSLRTNVDVLQDSQTPTEAHGEIVGEMSDQLDELTAAMTDLIELARGAEPEATFEEIRLDHLVEDCLERARRLAPSLRFQALLKPAPISGVPDRVGRAVDNLLENAIKWSPPDGVVEVEVSGRSVTVRDHGPGVPEADLPHIFDRFYRASTATEIPGSGLGLAIVRQVAERHGGSVSAEAADGGGTRFQLSFGSSAPR